MLPPLRSLQPAESCPLPAAAVCAVNSRIHVQIRPRASYNLDQLPKDFLHDGQELTALTWQRTEVPRGRGLPTLRGSQLSRYL